MGLFVSEIGEQLQGASNKSLIGGERGSYCRISQLPSCGAYLGYGNDSGPNSPLF
jgi:hypothetical protein